MHWTSLGLKRLEKLETKKYSIESNPTNDAFSQCKSVAPGFMFFNVPGSLFPIF